MVARSTQEYIRVDAAYGQAERFWDLNFSTLQASYAGVDPDMLKQISVSVESDGTLEFNAGYADGSPENQAERALFSTYRDAIVEALLKTIKRTPEYEPFFTRSAISAEARSERLGILDADIEDHSLNDNDD